MKAHKVPATYYSGWNANGYNHSFYVFYKNKLTDEGILKSYRKVDSITKEHSYFMEEDFYYIKFSIKGISFKLKNEISDFLQEKKYKIVCKDTLADAYDGVNVPTVIIDDYYKFMTYWDDIAIWRIVNADGKVVTPEDFTTALDEYIFDKVGVLIEEDYFANYLEKMWNDIRSSIINDIANKATGDDVTLSRRMDLLEFFVVQYLRMDKQIIPKIKKGLTFFENIFVDMGADTQTMLAIEQSGMLSHEPYFFGTLLDAARGDKRKIMRWVSTIDSNFAIDVLCSKTKEYLTSTNPCVFSKTISDEVVEMFFPITNNLCLRFRKKAENISNGKYIEQTDAEVRMTNASIICKADDIVISNCKNITNFI